MQMVFGDYGRRMTDDREGQTRTARAAHPRSSRDDRGFIWAPSNNSFVFNFFPDGTTMQGAETAGMNPAAQEPGARGAAAPSTGQGEGFTFNFHIPSETPVEAGPGADTAASVGQGDPGVGAVDNSQDTEQSTKSADSTVKKKKPRKKKKKSEGTEGQNKTTVASQSGASSSTAEPVCVLTAEQMLARELDWCIEQLELGLRTQKSTPKQMEEASRALKTLRSGKAHLAKKRQVMRTVFGDYRKKMEEENARQVKLIKEAVKSARVTAVSEPIKKPVFRRRAECRRQSQGQKQSDQGQSETQTPEGGPRSDSERFVFTPSQEEFCFSFF
ncbi:UPF0488 protein C8orf33 homolog isoform X1 [Scleropages formosus]|uniref:Zgc:112185 n=1 Tax=Scleropages formosus TaxID=113540 RepID=A0A8C9TML7_SCLFO|nr:UPF0488 protein C8orf33 homolog isoform X1 [Scleropages formosus]XP_018590423.1 UPF0488 protein C8orf33 homolog isoform X1 [Scleropages formosus]XP_018590424.1 UPF0488 protein C8orf33 homolog isoform X1 [Scleropages formosus]